MKFKKLLCLMFCMLMLLAVPAVAAEDDSVTVLFTHDMHSHLLPATDAQGKSYGGYARLKTLIDEQKAEHPNAVLVDGGDFSMGTLFHSVYATDAIELRIMGAMGYDVTTFGNHEYDFRPAGLARMLNAAVDSGEKLPEIVEANYFPPEPGADGSTADTEAVRAAFERYGVKDYTVIERGGVNFAVFGMMGVVSHEMAPMSGMELHDITASAQAVVDKIKAEVPEPCVVICLSHAGTDDDKSNSEDEQLAAKVKGIDVIVSSHTHTTLFEPIVVGDTYIVSCCEYSKYLGVLTLKPDGDAYALVDYQLVPVDDTVADDAEIAAQVESYKTLVEKNYLSQYGDLTFDGVLAYNPYEFDSTDDLDMHKESAYGNLIADAYKWVVENVEGPGGQPVDFALNANGLIRESLPVGDVTTEQVFNALSLGVGADGVPDYPLVSVWITGEDLKNAFEVDASVTAIMPEAQLYFTGMEFTFNPNRMIFNKVTDSAQVLADGSRVEIVDDQLYRVVTGLYCGQMLSAVNSKSFGILNITPRDAEGNEITNMDDFIVHNADGTEIKEWNALASYLMHLGTVPADYSDVMGRKVIVDSWNPVELLKNPNWITLLVLAIIIILIAVIVLVVWAIRRRRRRRRI